MFYIHSFDDAERYRCVGACGICVCFRLWSCSLLHMYHFKKVRMINDPYLPLGLHVKAVFFALLQKMKSIMSPL